MKIAYFQNQYPVLTQTFVSNEIAGLMQRGHQVVVVSSRPGMFPAEGDATVIALKGIPARRILRAHVNMLIETPRLYFGYAWHLVSLGMSTMPWGLWVPFLLRDGNLDSVDYIHTHFATRAAATARLFAQTRKLRRGVTTHAADIFKPNKYLNRQLEGAAVATSTTHNLDVMREHGYENVQLIRNGVSVRTTMRAPRRAGQPHIVSVGRLIPKKGHEDLIRAIGLLHERGFNATCDIVGSGPDAKKLSALIRHLRLDAAVALVGSKSHDETFEYYAQADVFALASRLGESGDVDGLPVALLDAASVGIPIVATRVSGLAEFVDDDIAWTAQPNDPNSLAQALAEVLTNYAMAEERATDARKRVEFEYSIDAQLDGIEKLAKVSHV